MEPQKPPQKYTYTLTGPYSVAGPYNTVSTKTEEDIGILAEETYNRIKQSKNPSLLPEAEKVLREAITLSEVNRSDNKFNLATCLSYQNRKEEAIAIYTELIEENPEDYRALTFLASAMAQKQRNHEEAIKLIEKSVNIIENKKNQILALGPEIAAEYNNELENMKEIQGINHIEIGEHYVREKRYDLAEAHLKQALTLTGEENDVNRATIYSNLGDIYLHKGILDDAIRIYKVAEKYENATPYIFTGLAEAYLRKNNYTEALANCIKAFDRNDKFIWGDTNQNILAKTIKIFNTYKSNGGTLKESLYNVKQAIEETGINTATSKILLAFFQYAQQCLKDKSVNEYAANLLFSDPCLQTENGSFTNLRRDTAQIIRPTHLMLVNTFGDLEYVIKMNDPNNSDPEVKRKMKDEYITQSFLSNILALHKEEKCLDKNSLEIEEPLFYLENEKNFVSIQRRIKSMTLKAFEEIADKEELESEIYRTINTGVLINILATQVLRKDEEGHYFEIADEQGNQYQTRINRFDYGENLKRRFLDRLNISEKEKEKYADQHFQFVDRWTNNQLKYFIHGDLNACNAMIGGQIIDFEMKAIGNPAYDFMHLITNIDFTDVDSEKLKTHFIKKMIEYNVPQENVVKMISTMEQNKIHIQICKIGSNINQEQYERAKDYLEKTLQDLEKINHKPLLRTLEKIMKGQLPC